MARDEYGFGDDYGDDYGGGYGSGSDSSTFAPSYTDRSPTTSPPSTSDEGFRSSFHEQTDYTAPSAPAATPAVDPSVTADTKARSIYQQLKGAGHDVKWQGNTLMVDGRPYTVTDPNAVSSFMSSAPAPAGFDQAKWSDATKQDPKYIVGRALANGASVADAAAAIGATQVGPDLIRMADGTTVDVKFDVGGPRDAPQWLPWDNNGAGGSGGMSPSYGAAAGGASGSMPGGYTPRFTFDSLLSDLRGGSNMGGLDSLVSSLQANPDAIDPHAVDTLKARMKDTLAQQGQFEQQNLNAAGTRLGIADSPWLASERLARDRSTNQAIAAGGQDIDIEAAKENAASRRAVAGVGVQYQNLRGQQLQQAVGSALQSAGINFNYAQLSTQNEQFLQDLGLRLQALEQADKQFGATYGLQVGQLNEQIANDAWAQSYADRLG